MKVMTADEIKVKQDMGRKVYWRNGYAWIAKYYNSKWWNPLDWYKVKVKP